MNVKKQSSENGVLTLALAGHIDSSKAAQVEQEIAAIRASEPQAEPVLDAKDLTYISSAGLRVVLRLRKESPKLKITNVSPEVYEILDMTGFTEMLTVEKAYRQLSVEGCEVIGQGANGKVYRLDPDTIIKVYMRPDCLDDVNRERELARKAFVLGIPTAIPYDVVRVDGKYGSVFELLNAKSFSKLIVAEPEKLEKYVELYVDLLKKIHATVVSPDDMPSAKSVAVSWVHDLKNELPPEHWSKLLHLVSDVPESNHMIHGDYHTKNVMLQNGEVLLIDMDTLSYGHPVFEFLGIFNAYIGYEETYPKERVGEFLGLNYEQVHAIWENTMKLYFGTDDKAVLDAIAEKIMVLGYTRILRRTLKRNSDTDEGKLIIAGTRKKLTELIERVDSLDF